MWTKFVFVFDIVYESLKCSHKLFSEVYYENQKSRCKACRTFKRFICFCAKENGRRLGRYAL